MFCYKLLSVFIIHQDLSFGGIALKIEFVDFVYELINYEIIKPVRPARAWFLEIDPVQIICMFACVCVRPRGY